MTDKEKKAPKAVNVPKTDHAFGVAEALDDGDVEKVAGGLGRHAVDDTTEDPFRNIPGGQSGGQSGGTGTATN